MDFAFSEEHELFRSTVRKFAERELAPHYQRHDRDQSFPEQQLRDVIGLEIGDGTAQVSKIVISREVFGREFKPY